MGFLTSLSMIENGGNLISRGKRNNLEVCDYTSSNIVAINEVRQKYLYKYPMNSFRMNNYFTKCYHILVIF